MVDDNCPLPQDEDGRRVPADDKEGTTEAPLPHRKSSLHIFLCIHLGSQFQSITIHLPELSLEQLQLGCNSLIFATMVSNSTTMLLLFKASTSS